MTTYTALYVYTDKDHKKRSARYGQHFHVTGYWKGGIVKVLWHTDNKTGHVREGEYKSIQAWQQEEGKADTALRKRESTSKYWTEKSYNQIAEVLRSVNNDVSCAMHKYRADQDKANSFELERT